MTVSPALSSVSRWTLFACCWTGILGANPTLGLCSAVDAKRPDIVQLLIARGANVNVNCSDTDRPILLEAAEYGNNKIVRLLKAAGARK